VDLILFSHPDQLHDIQQVVQGKSSVPELVLFPQAFRHRKKQEPVDVRARQGGCSRIRRRRMSFA
jgi:hypothetical protein